MWVPSHTHHARRWARKPTKRSTPSRAVPEPALTAPVAFWLVGWCVCAGEGVHLNDAEFDRALDEFDAEHKRRGRPYKDLG